MVLNHIPYITGLSKTTMGQKCRHADLRMAVMSVRVCLD